MTSHAKQSELYARLQEVLGRQSAETLMTMLPISGQWATKADLADLASKTDLNELRVATKHDLNDLRTELKGDLSDLRTELKNDLAELRQDMRELRGELKSLVRTFAVAQTTAMVGLTGIFIGVNQLL